MKLIMLSAGFEQGGNCLHRHLDGHPNLLVYPFESMLGTPLSSNILTPSVPYRYCWPEFSIEMTALDAYHSFYDEEMKTYLRTPDRSKFKNCGMIMDESLRIKNFCDSYEHSKHLNINKRKFFINEYFRSAFYSWENLERSGEGSNEETHYVGYIPMIHMDADKIFKDFPDAKMIHIIRNPWSGYADTLKRPFPYSLEKYCQVWNIAQLQALTLEEKYWGNFKIIFFENLCKNLKQEMEDLCIFLNIPFSDNILYSSFNGEKLDTIYPWGTIKHVTTEENVKTAQELSEEQIQQIEIECRVMLEMLEYRKDFSDL